VLQYSLAKIKDRSFKVTQSKHQRRVAIEQKFGRQQNTTAAGAAQAVLMQRRKYLQTAATDKIDQLIRSLEQQLQHLHLIHAG